MKKFFTYILIAVFTIFSSSIYGQLNKTDKKKFNLAVNYSEKGNFEKAIDVLRVIEKENTNDMSVMYLLGTCYLNAGIKMDSALYFLNKVEKKIPRSEMKSKNNLDLLYSLAEVNSLNYKFNKAIDYYNILLSLTSDENTEEIGYIKKKISNCKTALMLVEHPVKLEVFNLGDAVNSIYDDHSPLISADESMLLFTSRRNNGEDDNVLDDGQYTEKIYVSSLRDSLREDAILLSSILQNRGHQAGVSLSPDGTELYILRSNSAGQNLYVSNFDGESWSEPYKLPKSINSDDRETHASINADKTTLYFTSDRKGGYGGLDIYCVRKLPNGQWGTAKNLGPNINTPYDEETPMIHPNGQMLYFSSEGHNTMGKFDIFISKLNADSTWQKPINMGYPINTPDDDFFFVPTVKTNKAYMASSRFKDSQGRSDLYVVNYEEPPAKKLSVLKGKVNVPEDVDIHSVEVLVYSKKTNKLVGRYKPNPGTGYYTLILPTGEDFLIDFIIDNKKVKNTSMAINKDMTYAVVNKAVMLNEQSLVPVKPVEPEDAKDITKANEKASDNAPSGKYTVQFVTLKKVLKDMSVLKVPDANLIRIYECKDGNVRYVYGNFDTFTKAKKAKEEVIKTTGYSDPFVRYFWQLDKLKK